MGALRTHPSLMLFIPGMLCSPLLQAQGIFYAYFSQVWFPILPGALLSEGQAISCQDILGLILQWQKTKNNELKSRKGKQRDYENVSKRLDYILFSSGYIYLAGICSTQEKKPF